MRKSPIMWGDSFDNIFVNELEQAMTINQSRFLTHQRIINTMKSGFVECNPVSLTTLSRDNKEKVWHVLTIKVPMFFA